MILATLLLAEIVSQSQPLNIFEERYSAESKNRYEAYVMCFARGAYDRRQDAGSPEAHMKAAQAVCGKEYDSFVESVVKDSESSSDAASAAVKARSLLDAMDARALIGPPAPTVLAQLPVERLTGDWRLGSGPLAIDMRVSFREDGSLFGILKSDFDKWAGGLNSWRVTSDGTKNATFHAYFAGKKEVRYDRIPSSPSEMNFINAADPSIQRFDLVMEDNDLLIRWVEPDGGGTLRFRRQVGPAQGAKKD